MIGTNPIATFAIATIDIVTLRGGTRRQRQMKSLIRVSKIRRKCR